MIKILLAIFLLALAFFCINPGEMPVNNLLFYIVFYFLIKEIKEILE